VCCGGERVEAVVGVGCNNDDDSVKLEMPLVLEI